MKNTVVILLLFLAFAASGHAQTSDDAAKQAFDSGVSAYNAGNYTAAATWFRKAYALRSGYTLFYNIGQCEASAKRYGLAYEAFERYLAEGGDEITSTRRDEVVAELNRLENLIGAVRVTAPKGSVVRIDGEDRGVAPLPGALKIGIGIPHEIVVLKDNQAIHSESIKVSRGETLAIAVHSDGNPKAIVASHDATSRTAEASEENSQPSETQSPFATPIDRPDIHSIRQRQMAIGITLGVGGALLIGSGITGALALSYNADLQSSCSNAVCTNPDDQNKLSKRDVLAPLSTGLLVAGIATAALSIPVIIRHHRAKALGTRNSALQLFPLLGQGTAGLFITGSTGR